LGHSRLRHNSRTSSEAKTFCNSHHLHIYPLVSERGLRAVDNSLQQARRRNPVVFTIALPISFQATQAIWPCQRVAF
jgi:hypothetical protein